MYYWFWGMNLWWWVFWFAIIAVFFTLMVPVSRSRYQDHYVNPLSILRRRYAAGEITTEEYEERRTRLERDIAAPPVRPLQGSRADRHQPA